MKYIRSTCNNEQLTVLQDNDYNIHIYREDQDDIDAETWEIVVRLVKNPLIMPNFMLLVICHFLSHTEVLFCCL